jgi:hypothetical protein
MKMKAEPKVIIVILRRPKKKTDMRTDPLWEYGSFGCTRCHNTNLMNPCKGHELIGARLAFAQGGKEGFKLIHLTPPIEIIHWKAIADNNQDGDFLEAKWSPATMPFKYSTAPTLINNKGKTDFRSLKNLLKRFIKVKRQSYVGKLSSKFRTCRKPLDKDIAEEIICVFEGLDTHDKLASYYYEALPYELSEPDNKRTRLLKYREKKQGYAAHQIQYNTEINNRKKFTKMCSGCKKSCR